MVQHGDQALLHQIKLKGIDPILGEVDQRVPTDRDAIGIVPVGAQQSVCSEQHSPDHQKMDEGISQPRRYPGGLATRLSQGVYQIGDERARSWIATGRPVTSAGSNPIATASYVEYRGVGISRTRT